MVIGLEYFQSANLCWTGILLMVSKFYGTSESFDTGHSFVSKLKYVSLVSELKTACRKFDPDLMHAHYATSYGLLAALSGFKPYLISVWGSDVFDFPKAFFFASTNLKI
jgi:hypothetical protein